MEVVEGPISFRDLRKQPRAGRFRRRQSMDTSGFTGGCEIRTWRSVPA